MRCPDPARRLRSCLLAAACLALPAQTRRAEGVAKLPEGAVVAVMPMDVELFSLTAGGVMEPKADWTDQARRNLTGALTAHAAGKVVFQSFQGALEGPLAELGHLQDAVASSIFMYHFGALKLPGKAGRLDWTLGDGVVPLREASHADYALYLFMRDSTSTGGRAATMAVMALFGVGVAGGQQLGYATLVDLRTGQVVWFNYLHRFSGDLREPEPARKTLDALLQDFPE